MQIRASKEFAHKYANKEKIKGLRHKNPLSGKYTFNQFSENDEVEMIGKNLIGSRRNAGLKTLQKQREFMDKLYDKYQLNNLDDWLNVGYKFKKEDGKFLCSNYYNNDFSHLLSSIYPNYGWEFSKTKLLSKKNFKTMKEQRSFMNHLFIKYNLKELDDWLNNIRNSIKIIQQNGGKELLKIYKQNFQLLLSNIYPAHDWNFSNLIFKTSQNYFKSSIDNQHHFMENLFIKLNLKSLDEWLSIKRIKIISNGGRTLIEMYENLFSLLSNLYPHFPWEFKSKSLSIMKEKKLKIKRRKKISKLESIEYQREIMDKLFIKLKLKSIDDWVDVKKKEMKKNGARYLLQFYQGSKFQLLSKIYENHQWNFTENSQKKKLILQRKKMDKLFRKLKLKTLDDWLNLNDKKIHLLSPLFSSSSSSLLSLGDDHYKKNFAKFLSNIYPNYCWDFTPLQFHFKTIENQKEFLDQLFIKLKLNSLDDWMNISIKIIKNNGGKKLLKNYQNNLQLLFTSIYPDHHFQYRNNENENEKKLPSGKQKKISYFKSKENQRKFLNDLFIQFKLKSFDDWKKISPKIIKKYGGKRLIEKIYKNDLISLFQSIYPNYPWRFSSIYFNKLKFSSSFSSSNSSLLSPILSQSEYQKELLMKNRKEMEKLFKKFHLEYFEDWKKISISKIVLSASENLINTITSQYKNDIKIFFPSIYPNYPWQFSLEKLNVKFKSKNDYNKEENNFIYKDKKEMNKLFKKFKLKSLEDWKKISISKIIQFSSERLNNQINSQYRKDLKFLLPLIYPNYPWHFSFEITTKLSLKSKINYKNDEIIYKDRKEMDKLYKKFKLKSLEEWKKISISKFIYFASEKLNQTITYQYQKEMKNFLPFIYPNYPWQFPNEIKKLSFKLNKKDDINYKYKLLMDKLFKKFQLKSLEDWKKISILKILNNGGEKLINEYENNMNKILTSIYPNYPWQLINFNSIENQRKFLEKLFIKYKLKSLDDWLIVERGKRIIIKNGGEELLKKYNRDYYLLLSTIFPQHQWKFPTLKTRLNSIKSQQKIMDNFFKKFHLSTLFDWFNLLERLIIRRITYEDDINLLKLNPFERRLLISFLNLYKNNTKKIFITIYPNYPWNFNSSELREFILHNIRLYNITQKKDWYRLPLDEGRKFELLQSLFDFFPSEKWNKFNFLARFKRSTQRLLLGFTQKIYPSFLIIEEYLHPHLVSENISSYELDIYIPALQLALEYQGQQHYDDIPQAFANIESSQLRDGEKEKLASEQSIKIIYIPFWWDQTLHSLRASLQSN